MDSTYVYDVAPSENALLPMDIFHDVAKNMNLLIETQPKNTSAPIVVTEAGITINSRVVHCLNALPSIDVTESGIV